jgi:hypothetical protein
MPTKRAHFPPLLNSSKSKVIEPQQINSRKNSSVIENIHQRRLGKLQRKDSAASSILEYNEHGNTPTDELSSPPPQIVPSHHQKTTSNNNNGIAQLRNIKPAKRRSKEVDNPWVVPTSKQHREPLSIDMASLFELLWEKATPAAHGGFQSCPGIYIPDTVCFRSEAYSQPQWFFTSAQDGRIYKKNSVNVTADNIQRVFSKKFKSQVKRFMELNKNPPPPVKTSIVAYGVFEHNFVGETYYTTEFFDIKSLSM